VPRGVLVGFRSRRDIAPENLVLRHQLQVALRTNSTPRLSNPDRILWTWLRLWPSWRDHLLVVKPATVIRWHRKGCASISVGGRAPRLGVLA
jgi:hypothetical protein